MSDHYNPSQLFTTVEELRDNINESITVNNHDRDINDHAFAALAEKESL